MIKKLAVPLLVVGLAFAGCGDDDKKTPDAAAAGTGGGGSGGGGAGGGGTGGGGAGGSTVDAGTTDTAAAGAGGTAGAAGDASTSDTAAGDTAAGDTAAGDTGSAVNWTMCPASGSLPGVSAADFCKQYMTACTFAAGAAGMERYATEADCLAKYAALPTANAAKGQACAAYHLCVASQSAANAMTHCPHPPQASIPSGPCAP